MIKFTQDRRPRGYLDVYVNPSDVMSINDIAGEFSTENRSRITLRNGDAYNVTDYASTVAEKINSALEKLEVHPPDPIPYGTALVDKPSTLNTEPPRVTFTC